MEQWANYRLSPGSLLPSDKYRFGDLYGFSHLPEYKTKDFKASDLRQHFVQTRQANNINLYALCDSYLKSYIKSDSLFQHADTYTSVRWDSEQKDFFLPVDKKNILLIELVERSVRIRFRDTAFVFRHLGAAVSRKGKVSNRALNSNLETWVQTHIFNKNIEENLEFNLFDYPVFTGLRELKAQINYNVFNRKSPDVVVSKSRNRLYYAQTTDSLQSTGSFAPVRDGEIDSLVTSLNTVYHHYRKAGFAEVYLAIVPNPVTILEPEMGSYNLLIPRIQQHPSLRMPVLDVYSKLKALRTEPIFQRTDSHWDKAGLLAGLAQIDSALATQRKQPLMKGKKDPLK